MRERSPAAERNGPVLLEVLRAAVPPGARVLEIACGTGQHAALLAPGLAASSWVPTDLAPERFASVRAWTEGIAAVAAPRVLDARAPDSWPDIEVDLVLAVNMVHISPWAATLGLLAGARRRAPQGVLALYGPYRRGGAHTAPSNEAFDADLRRRDPDWGVRDLETVVAEAEAVGWRLREVAPMPANNLTVLFEAVR